MKKRTMAAVIASALAIGCISGCGPYRFRTSSRGSSSCNRRYYPSNPGHHPRYRVGLPRHATPHNIQSKFRRDVDYL